MTMEFAGVLMGSDLDGVPFPVWFVLIGAALTATGIARLRQRRFEAKGNRAKARQMRLHVPLGLFICALIVARIAFRA
jgi:hypothetical protein